MASLLLRRRGRCGNCIFFQNNYCLLKGKPVRPSYYGCKFFSSGDIIGILKRELNKEEYYNRLVRYSIFVFLLFFPMITNTNPIDSLIALVLGTLSFFGIEVRK